MVDDDPSIVDMIVDFLGTLSEPLSITRASDGQAAIESVQRERQDLVLLDIFMPVMNGIETLKRIRKIDPKMPVLMITGADSASASEALKNGAFGYFPKPMDLRYVGPLVTLALGATRTAVPA